MNGRAILYLLDETFPYELVVAEDCGAPFASQYDWLAVTRVEPDFAGAVVVDPRFTPAALPTLRAAIEGGCATYFLRLTDPYWEGCRDHWWFLFVREMAANRNVHVMLTYGPSEATSLVWSESQGKICVYAPYLYDKRNERPINHALRYRKLVLSGQISRHFYPLRSSALSFSRFWPPLGRMLDHLKHPGYPDVGQKQSHSTVGQAYIDHLAQYRFAFVCGSRDRLEFLKYREIAYAGAVPVGALPDTLLDCPADAWISWRRNLPALQRRLTTCDSEAMAFAFRKFMSEKRSVDRLRNKVNAVIMSCASASTPT